MHSGMLKRFVSILSQKKLLCDVFNKPPPSFVAIAKTDKKTGLFQLPELCDSSGFYTLRTSCIEKSSHLVQEAIDSDNRTRALVQVFDELSDNLCRVADLSEFIRCAHTNVDYNRAAANTCSEVSGLVEKLNTNKELYMALKNVVDSGDKFDETILCKRVNELFFLDFQQSGIHLDDAIREKIVLLNDIIMQLGQLFVNGGNKETLISRKQVPHDLRHRFSGNETHFHVGGLYSDASEPEVRALGYRFFLQHDPHQDELLTGLLSARNQLAKNCGFKTYTERCLRGALLDKSDTVMCFLDYLALHVKPKALLELNALRRIRNEDLSVKEPIPIWDVPYYTAIYKSNLFNVESQYYSAYLSLGNCMQGLCSLFRTLYGITLNYVDMEPGEVHVLTYFTQ